MDSIIYTTTDLPTNPFCEQRGDVALRNGGAPNDAFTSCPPFISASCSYLFAALRDDFGYLRAFSRRLKAGETWVRMCDGLLPIVEISETRRPALIGVVYHDAHRKNLSMLFLVAFVTLRTFASLPSSVSQFKPQHIRGTAKSFRHAVRKRQSGPFCRAQICFAPPIRFNLGPK
jgi:hypothetical protein